MRDRAGILSPRSDPPKAALRWSYRLHGFIAPGEAPQEREYRDLRDETAPTPRAHVMRLRHGWELIGKKWYKPCHGKCGKMLRLHRFSGYMGDGYPKWNSLCRECEKVAK